MSEAVQIWERPEADEIYLLAGWRQWADAGAVSSGLPRYLVKRLRARPIGEIKPDGFYLFQFPGTHDLVRPVVRFEDGFPVALQTPSNEIFYTTVGKQPENRKGVVILLGDEPHMDIARYVDALIDFAQEIGARRIVSFGGVYGELPYQKERMVSAIYSQRRLKESLSALAVNFSDYHGGASIGSYLCKRAAERDFEYVGFYAFAPTYDFSNLAQVDTTIRIENDYMAWLAIMRRVTHMLKLEINLSDLERKSRRLVQVMDDKIDELENSAPELGARRYFQELADEFEEQAFDPLDEVWDEELKRLLDKFDENAEE